MCGLLFTNDSKTKTELFEEALGKIHHRGPDDVRYTQAVGAQLGFSRLAIMDLSHEGDQPFIHDQTYYMCNGEIYNHKLLREKYPFDYQSESDCEVLIPLFKEFGMPKLLEEIDGEYAFVIFDEESGEVFAARDPMGIRPLFYGVHDDGSISFASEVKALQDICTDVHPFPPGHFYAQGEIKKFIDLSEVTDKREDSLEDVYQNINKLLTQGVVKRLNSDAPVGFLLSGGLDSSLVCAIAQKHSDKPIRTFAIGMSEDAIDLKYAKEVADHIGSDHTEVLMTKDDVLGCLKDVVYHLESYDITTVRASVGMYLVCQYIKEKTDIKVLLTGEVSDEVFGYKYTDFAPSPFEFQKEASKRVKELYLYDVLRADRCLSAHSLEARVPFSDTEFVRYIMSLDPAKKMNVYGQGKYLLRKAFEQGDYLPHSILYREKAAFSDAVGHSMVDYLKQYADSIYTTKEYLELVDRYDHAKPFTKESLLYRQLFEEFYPHKAHLVPNFWMPNKDWDNCDVADPSARVLPNYGESGV